MFRQGLRRCARPASSLALATALARPRAALAFRQNTLPSITKSATLLRSSAIVQRLYSTEATATAEESPRSANPHPTAQVELFADLEKLGVHPNLISSITKDMGYERMTPVQAKTINPALKGTDIVAQAKTGTGKTIAFLLPLLQRMIDEDPSLASRSASRHARSDDIRGIVLSPTRELAEQIAVEARALTRHTGLVVQTAVGGTNKPAMLRQTQRQGCHLLVATPGRLNDLLQDPSSGIDCPNLAALVLDEGDRMLDAGFQGELDEIVRCLPPPEEKVRQTMLVSATIPDNVIRLARSMVRPDDFEFVQTIPENETLTHDQVPQSVVPVSSWNNVFPTLFELIDKETKKADENPNAHPFKAIVYFNTTGLTEMAGELGYLRRREGLSRVSSFCIHSRLTQNQRGRAADMFRQARSAILYSSDVTARGMDFPNVTHVIQVDIPRERESYIHRLGRTGRQGKEGQGWLLLPPLSVGTARGLLRGLPLQQDNSFESAEINPPAEELPPLFEQVKELVNRLPKSMLQVAYSSLYGVNSNKDKLSQDLYHWATSGWGWDAPPEVSHRWVRNLNLDPKYLNVGSGMASRNTGGYPRVRAENFGRRGGGRRDEDPEDPFGEMRSRVRRDDGGFGRRDEGGFGRRDGGGFGRRDRGRGGFENRRGYDRSEPRSRF